MSPAGALAIASCLAVNPHSDYITAGDLAAAVPGFERVAAETQVALAPAPGVRRILYAAESERIAARLKLSLTAPPNVCFERRVTPLDESAIQAAMHRALPDAKIAVISYNHSPVPEGELEFPSARLYQTSSGPLWKGFVRYGSNHQYSVWVKVDVQVTATHVVATSPLPPGLPVTLSQVRLETREELPLEGDWAVSVDEIVGRIPRRPIAAGASLPRSWFEAPKEISRGDRIRVDVWSGNAHLEFEGTAEASGAVGQSISVLNPGSKRRFQARVEGPGRASVRRDVR
jgi:flagella basal body P-ring formation protein FlgA